MAGRQATALLFIRIIQSIPYGVQCHPAFFSRYTIASTLATACYPLVGTCLSMSIFLARELARVTFRLLAGQ